MQHQHLSVLLSAAVLPISKWVVTLPVAMGQSPVMYPMVVLALGSLEAAVALALLLPGALLAPLEHEPPKLCNQVRSLDHFMVQNSGDFFC